MVFTPGILTIKGLLGLLVGIYVEPIKGFVPCGLLKGFTGGTGWTGLIGGDGLPLAFGTVELFTGGCPVLLPERLDPLKSVFPQPKSIKLIAKTLKISIKTSPQKK